MENYIEKNKVRAATAKIARGRQKQLDRIERMDAPSFNILKPVIIFNYTEATPKVLLSVKDLTVGYDHQILPKLNFKIKNGEKVVITGFNGIGKSTLLKTTVGEIKKLSGEVEFGYKVKPAYYEQDLKWADNEKTPIEIISDYYPKLTKKEVRRHLSQCGVKNETAMQKIRTLSGGEQSKVKLCNLTMTECNLLILDEVTNYMDSVTKEALRDSLISFEGTVILVSHESAFYEDWADRIINIEEFI